MKKLLFAVALAVAAVGLAAHPTQANTVQYQGVSSTKNNTNVAAIPSNTNLAMVSSRVEGWQVPRGGYQGYPASTGRVLVSWAPRGGTCNIRYTETKEAFFKYRTSAGCDEIHHVVGSLIPGERYRFEVAKDNWDNWSDSAIAIAR